MLVQGACPGMPGMLVQGACTGMPGMCVPPWRAMPCCRSERVESPWRKQARQEGVKAVCEGEKCTLEAPLVLLISALQRRGREERERG